MKPEHFSSRKLLSVFLTIFFLIISVSGSKGDILPLPLSERKAYEALSPFEFKDVLSKEAKNACQKEIEKGNNCRVLDAGRGNPIFLIQRYGKRLLI